MKKVLLSCLMVFLTTFAFAQSKVTGTITAAEDGSGLPGVSVRIKNTTKGTQTNAMGKYSIEAKKGDVLQISFIGYTLQEVNVGNQSVLDVSLISDDRVLQEVVVTALGVKRSERSLGYAVQQVSGEGLAQARET
ncbi:MAG: hypothetical protein ACI964_001654, partial [Spirosomataceae bacterium]